MEMVLTESKQKKFKRFDESVMFILDLIGSGLMLSKPIELFSTAEVIDIANDLYNEAWAEVLDFDGGPH